MSERGGHADKIGNRYEALWVAKQLLRVAQGQLKAVQAEALGEDEAGVDVWLTDASGSRIACQCKSGNATVGQWPMHTLGSRGVLGYMRTQLERDDVDGFRLVSGDPAPGLDALGKRARDNPGDPKQWLEHQVLVSKLCARDFKSFCKTLALDPSVSEALKTAFDLLRQASVVTFIDNEETRADLQSEIHQFFAGDPEGALSKLRAIAVDNPRRILHEDDVLQEMQAAGFEPRLRPDDDRSAPAIERLWDQFDHSIRPNLLAGALITRSQADDILGLLTAGTRIVAVHAPAGYGKSCLLYQVCQSLRIAGVPVLPLRLDRHPLKLNLEEYGRSLSLPGAPHYVLGSLANGRRGVLVIDQLDALRWTGKSAASEMTAFETLCRETLSYSNLSIVVACRSFDLKHDPMIASWFKTQEAVGVAVGELPEDAAVEIVTGRGRKWSGLTPRQKFVLRSPQALHLWLEFDSPRFSSMSDLMRAYMRAKTEQLAELGMDTEGQRVVDELLDYMERQLTLSVPSDRVDSRRRAANALQSVGLISDDGKRITFSHQSVPDYLSAYRTVKHMEDTGEPFIALAPGRDSQTLYFRHSLRHVLDLLRDRGCPAYQDTLHDILQGSGVRFHLKHMVLAWLGGLPNPTDLEQEVADRAYEDPGLRDHVLTLTYAGSVPWTRRLFRRGDILRAVKSTADEEVNGGLWLMWKVRGECGDEIFSVLSKGSLEDQRWQSFARYTLPFQPENDSDTLFEYRLDLARRGVSGEEHFWKKLASTSPRRLVRLLAAYSDGLLAYSRGESANPIAVAELHRWSEHLALARAGHAEAEEALRLLPERLQQLCKLEDTKDLEHGILEHTQEALILALSGALMAMGERAVEPELRQRAEAYLPLYRTLLMHAPRSLSDEILAWLFDDRTRLRSLSRGYSGHALGGGCRIVQRFAPSASEDAYRRLEEAVLSYEDKGELDSARRQAGTGDGPNRIGLSKYFLLTSLPAHRISSHARAELEILGRKFKGSHWLDYPRHHHRGGSVRSPLTDERARILSDRSWLKIVKSNRTTGEKHDCSIDGAVIVSGVEEFANSLGFVSQLHPERFCVLALKFPKAATRYISAVLSAVCWKRPPDQATPAEREVWSPASAAAVEELMRFLCENWHESYTHSFARLVEAYPDAEYAGVVMERLLTLAEHPDPKAGEEYEWASDGEDDHIARNLEAQAINCTRGVVARAIAAMVRHRPEVTDRLQTTMDKLLADPHPAVRLAALDIASALTAQDATLGIDRFLAAVADVEEQVLITQMSRRMIGWAYKRDPGRIGALVAEMCESKDTEVARHGASMATAIAVVHGADASLLQRCLSGSVSHRKGVASAAAELFRGPEHVSSTIPVLRRLMTDSSQDVRGEARRCFWGQAWLEDDEATAFAIECGQSTAVQENPETLVHSLHECPGDLLRHADLIFAICDAYRGRLAGQTRSISNAGSAGPHWLGPVVFRLYEQATQARDEEAVQRSLDAIDGLLEERVGVGDDLASTFDS